jgi:hypothetical protein
MSSGLLKTITAARSLLLPASRTITRRLCHGCVKPSAPGTLLVFEAAAVAEAPEQRGAMNKLYNRRNFWKRSRSRKASQGKKTA